MSFDRNDLYTKLGLQLLKSEVAIASLLRQIQQTKNFLLEVKTITKLPGNHLSNLVIYIKKAEFSGFKA